MAAQIKTIVGKASLPNLFDAEVNKALKNGWTLQYREVIKVENEVLLIAELGGSTNLY